MRHAPHPAHGHKARRAPIRGVVRGKPLSARARALSVVAASRVRRTTGAERGRVQPRGSTSGDTESGGVRSAKQARDAAGQRDLVGGRRRLLLTDGGWRLGRRWRDGARAKDGSEELGEHDRPLRDLGELLAWRETNTLEV
jgi:hypothetical protein